MHFLTTVKAITIITILLLFFKPSLKAQEFDPFNGQSKQFHVRLERYFDTRNTEITERTMLLKRTDRFIDDHNWKPAVLKTKLIDYEKLMVEVERHEAYYKIIRLSNTKDTAASSAENLMENTTDRLTAAVEQNLRRIGPVDINKYGLSAYRYLIIQAQQQNGKNLSPQDLNFISQLSDPLLNGLINRYDALIDSIKAPPRNTNAYYEAYSAHKEVAAATLIDITRCETTLARAYGFPNATSAKYQNRLQNGEDSVKVLLVALQNRADVLKDYQNLMIQHIKKQTGQTTIHSWDLNIPGVDVPEKQNFEQSKTIILQALKPLGQDYVNHFAWLLDQQNGTLEIAGGANRAGGGTSISYPQVPTSFYMKRFNGDLQSMLTMIHEGGHAIHKKLMGETLAVPTYASGPHFLFEAFAVFNELLLFDRLTDSAKSVTAKSYYTKRLVDFLAHELFTSAEEGTFEQDLYDGVATGKITGSNDIDSLYSDVMKKYDVFFPQEPERKSEWIQRPLFFEDPLYNINYLYAVLVACKLYDIAHHDPQNFANNYNKLLRNGFNDTADHLLKKYMGFNLGHEDLLNGAIRLMKTKVTDLKDFYR
jgi:oligoendopeptidase F